MEPPEPGDLAHDLMNIVGVARSMAADLRTVIQSEPDGIAEAVAELDRQTEYATEALRVVERRNQSGPMPVHLGAWAWSLRLWVRSLAVGDLGHATKQTLSLAPAIEAGIAMVRAIHPTRLVSVEWDERGLLFETSVSAHDETALGAAIAKLEQSGMRIEQVDRVPCRVRVYR